MRRFQRNVEFKLSRSPYCYRFSAWQEKAAAVKVLKLRVLALCPPTHSNSQKQNFLICRKIKQFVARAVLLI